MAGAFRWEANAPVAELEPGRSLPLRIRRVGPRSYSRRRRTPRGRRRLQGLHLVWCDWTVTKGWNWAGNAPDDSVITLRDLGVNEIFALDLEAP